MNTIEILRDSASRGINEYVKTIREVHRMRLADLHKAIEKYKDWKLFMVYFDLIDLLTHIFITKPHIIRKAYLELNRISRKLHERLDDGNTIFLIISDHGFVLSEDGVSGKHANYAFWSININEDWHPKDFTDYFNKILEWTRK
ncbi:MAG: hypothetical protein DRZ82_07295 [Thermoprotei archaeon]|nr:MAG: hypothetical protein DRZ82_07295 [Thermoprotei archaeon]